MTSLGTAFDWSGGASVAASMSLAEPSLPWVTMPLTSPLTSPAFPDSLYLSASLSVFGDLASIAVFTAAMNACLSKVPACWASIESTFAALAWPATSSVGGERGALRLLGLRRGRRVRLLGLGEPLTLPFTCANAGSSSGRHPGRRRRAAGAACPPAAARARPEPRRSATATAAWRLGRRRLRAPARAGLRAPSRRPCRAARPA